MGTYSTRNTGFWPLCPELCPPRSFGVEDVKQLIDKSLDCGPETLDDRLGMATGDYAVLAIVLRIADLRNGIDECPVFNLRARPRIGRSELVQADLRETTGFLERRTGGRAPDFL